MKGITQHNDLQQQESLYPYEAEPCDHLYDPGIEIEIINTWYRQQRKRNTSRMAKT